MSEAPLDGIRIAFEEAGSGPPVVLLHSFLCDGTMWAGQMPALAAGCRVVNVDLRGHGRSPRVEGPLELADLLADVLDLLDRLGVERAVWAGLSIGGMLSLRTALHHPARVAGLVLLDTHAGPERAWKRLQYGAMALGTRLLGWRPFVPQVSRLMFGRTTRRQRPQLVRDWAAGFSAVDVPSMLHVLGALNRRDSLLGQLGEIAAPALVVVGEEDVSLPPRFSQQIAASLRDSTLQVVAEAGHLSALEQPERVNRAMIGFLERIGWWGVAAGAGTPAERGGAEPG